MSLFSNYGTILDMNMSCVVVNYSLTNHISISEQRQYSEIRGIMENWKDHG